MRFSINLSKDVNTTEWNEFDISSGHPANTSYFANMYRGFLSEPVYLEAYFNKCKISQWLLCQSQAILNPFKLNIFSLCGPQVPKEYSCYYDDIFCHYISYLLDSLNAHNILLLNYALIRGIKESLLKQNRFKKIDKYSAYINKISSDEEILSSFHSSHRRYTRRAIKEGYLYSFKISVEEYYNLSLETYSRINKNSPSLHYIKKIERELVSYNKALISGVYVKEQLKAASIILHHGHNAYYLHGASATYKPHGATSYLHYENMRTLRNFGVFNYDMGGVLLSNESNESNENKDRSLELFKSQFGGNPIKTFGGSYR